MNQGNKIFEQDIIDRLAFNDSIDNFTNLDGSIKASLILLVLLIFISAQFIEKSDLNFLFLIVGFNLLIQVLVSAFKFLRDIK